jgi:hypothetical protein
VTTRRLVAAIGGVLVVLAVALFVYNSGFGYDALEYLVIGRSLNDGFLLYSFIPSKSWAIYSLVAAFLRLPGAATHAGVTALVTAILLCVAIATAFVVRARFSSRAAAGAAVLVGMGALFMELNFLQPTGFIYLSGLLAFAAVTVPNADERRGPWLVAGLWLGAGMAFKSVAAFYVAGLLAWLVCRHLFSGRSLGRSVLQAALIVLGFGAAVGVQAVYFAASGRLQPYLEWSFTFPLFHFPPRTEFLPKLYTKLLWVWLVAGGALVTSLHNTMRRAVYGDERTWLLLALGSSGLASILKLQASHYAFPGGAFLLIFVAVVFERWADAGYDGNPRTIVRFGAAVSAACLVSVVLYRPGAVARVFTVRSFADETPLRSRLQSLVRADERAIFFDEHLRLYWIADRYPDWAVLNTDVQTTWYVEHHAADLLRVFDDPRLAVVEFDPLSTTFGDPDFLRTPAARAFFRDFRSRLEAGFARRDDLAAPLVLWTRTR